MKKINEKKSFIASTKIIRTKYELIKFHLSERSRRIWAANEAKSIGRGGRQIVSTATGHLRSLLFKRECWILHKSW